MQSTEFEKNATDLAFNGTSAENSANQHDDVLLMCKDALPFIEARIPAVYAFSLPGA